jgi:DNA repair exonuclease SbcCD ATPase subunit
MIEKIRSIYPFIRLSLFIVVTFATILAGYSQYYRLHSNREKLYEGLYLKPKMQADIEILQKYQKEIHSELALIASSTTKIKTEADVKKVLDNLNTKLEKHDQQIKALRQAINPLRPEEVLTIARLKDAIDLLTTKIVEFEKEIDKKQDTFKSSVLRELDASSKTTNWLFVLLIPLIINLLYSIWKDRKEGKGK